MRQVTAPMSFSLKISIAFEAVCQVDESIQRPMVRQQHTSEGYILILLQLNHNLIPIKTRNYLSLMSQVSKRLDSCRDYQYWSSRFQTYVLSSRIPHLLPHVFIFSRDLDNLLLHVFLIFRITIINSWVIRRCSPIP